MEGAAVSLESYWAAHADEIGIADYRDPTVILYEGQTSSACGTASNAVGPFYCPTDEQIYMDTSFFDILVDQFGASGGSLAEMYVLAHEWGHHVQNLAGFLTPDRQRDTGANGGQVRIELQADCLAGAWMGDAANSTNADGEQVLEAPTRAEIETTISAAESIGDDHIMEQQGMEVQPEAFTHGTSEQRTTWLITGYEQGVGACDTFSVPDSQL
jgi:predicted metalloprotease